MIDKLIYLAVPLLVGLPWVWLGYKNQTEYRLWRFMGVLSSLLIWPILYPALLITILIFKAGEALDNKYNKTK